MVTIVQSLLLAASHHLSQYNWNASVQLKKTLNLYHSLGNSADDKLVIFFLCCQENRLWHFMQIVSIGDNLHEMSKPVFWEKF